MAVQNITNKQPHLKQQQFEQPFKLYYCGRECCNPGHSFGPAVRKQYLIHFIMSGHGIYKAAGKEYHVTAGQAFLIRPGEVTWYQADKQDPWTYAWLAFASDEENGNEQAEALLYEAGFYRNQYICSFKNTEEIDLLLGKIIKGIDNSEIRPTVISGYFLQVMGSLNPLILEGEFEKLQGSRYTGYDNIYMRRAVNYMEDNYAYPIVIDEIAGAIGIDRSYLYRLFIQNKQQSPKRFLTRLRINAAKEMLRETDYGLTEIALSCGFYDASSFCRTFAGVEGMTPGKYRRKMI